MPWILLVSITFSSLLEPPVPLQQCPSTSLFMNEQWNPWPQVSNELPELLQDFGIFVRSSTINSASFGQIAETINSNSFKYKLIPCKEQQKPFGSPAYCDRQEYPLGHGSALPSFSAAEIAQGIGFSVFDSRYKDLPGGQIPVKRRHSVCFTFISNHTLSSYPTAKIFVPFRIETAEKVGGASSRRIGWAFFKNTKFVTLRANQKQDKKYPLLIHPMHW